MWRSKKDAWRLARSLGGDALVNLIVEESHTCYMPEASLRTIPARSKSLWLITSASAGDSLRVGI